MTGVLFVCHANLCRSPMAEYLTRTVLAPHGVPVASAGTHALPGRSMHPYAAEVLTGQGLDPTRFHSREVSRDLLVDAEIVLTASRRERAYCASMAPPALGRIFTLRQFARLATAAGAVPPDLVADGRGTAVDRTGSGGPGVARARCGGGSGAVQRAVAVAARARSRLQPIGPEADDLVDPVGGGPADFRRCAEGIEAAVLPIVALIAAAG